MKKAFTLIELMIVVTILAILATIVIINVTAARGKANNASTLSALVNSQKVAAQCLYADYYLIGDNAGLLTYSPAGVNICADASIVGTWPTINLKASNGRIWSMDPETKGPTASAPGTTLSIEAVTNLGSYIVGDFAILCTLTGCEKQMCSSALAGACSSWPTTTSW